MVSFNIQSATIYGRQTCPNCDRAKTVLKNNNIDFEYIQLDSQEKIKEFSEKVVKELGSMVTSVPQIWVNDKYVGGFNELVKFIGDKKKEEANNIAFDKDF